MPRDKVLYECDNCHYQTNKKSHYEHHINRKFKCKEQPKQSIQKNPTINELHQLVVDLQNKIATTKVETAEPPLEYPFIPKQPKTQFECERCKACFQNHTGLAIHVSVCNGVDPFRCPHCNKYFASRPARCRHIKRMSCRKHNAETEITSTQNNCSKAVAPPEPYPVPPPICLPRPPTLDELNEHDFVFELDEYTAMTIALALKKSQQQTRSQFSKTKKKIPWNLRIMVWQKYMGVNAARGKCGCCKTAMISTFKFHCGHVVAQSKGGPTNIDNLRPICDSCNLLHRKTTCLTYYS